MSETVSGAMWQGDVPGR